MKRIVSLLFILITTVTFAQKSDCNCCSADQTAFDFWVGNWTVTHYNNGSPAGSSVIRKEENGCVIHENWTSAQAGYTGTSLNFFNTTTQQWEQLWVDNAGAHLKLKGNRIGNQMILTSDEFAKKDGKMYQNRITWTHLEDGKVRQLWEVLSEGQVVSVAFDGLYSPMEQ